MSGAAASRAPAIAAPAAPTESPPLVVWLGFMAMVFGNFMAMLDIQIVASAIGDIQAGVSASRDEISRVQSSYLIAEVIGIPLSGFLARAMGTRLLFTIAALSFGVASALCAMAWDMTSLITFRAIQGFVGAAMIPTTMATLYLVFPIKDQMMAGAIVGMVSTMAPSIGPSLGGAITEHFGWRALFSINIIPSILVATMVWRWVRIGRFDAATLKRIDFIGLIGLAVFLIFLEVFLEEGPEENWFASAEIWAYLIVCVLGGMLFFYRALTRELPIVDLRPLMVPTFAIGVSLGFVLGIAMFGPIFLQPLFLGQVRQLNAEQIGHMLWAQGLTMMVMAPIMGRFARALPDLRPLGFAGFVMVAVSCYMQTTFTAQTGFSELLWPQILRGAGMMLTFMSVMQPALQSLPAHIMHAGTGLFNLVRNLGGALGLAILGTVQTQSFAFHRQELYSGARLSDPYVGGRIAQNEAFLEGTGAAEPHRQAIMQYVSLLDREAFVMSFNDQFLLIAALAAASACFMIFMRRAPGDMTGQGAR